MSVHLHRSIREPIRVGITWEERWEGPDGGLIACWERGREMRSKGERGPRLRKKSVAKPRAFEEVQDDAELQAEAELQAAAELQTKNEPASVWADRGELLPLWWKGGQRKKLEAPTKRGSLQYLAMWQGLRNEDLTIVMTGKTVLVCTRTRQQVVFERDLPPESEPEP